jgi:transitional endoplasmic reticulum ATPase
MGETEGVVLPEADCAAPAVASAALRATRLAGGGAETALLIVEGVARAVHGGDLPAPSRSTTLPTIRSWSSPIAISRR